jgi:DNA repair exonuclease SbcCD ATPase subunit
MTLTEEQRGTVGFDLEKNRAAIDSAINSLLCEGWDNEASTVRGLVTEIERLRAIIDKPLEGRVWKIDLDTLNTSPDDAEFNMARRWHAAYRKAQNSNLLRKQEIERLRPYEKVAADLQACGSYVGIGPGEGDLPISERVRRCVNRLKETQHEYEQKLITKDARIQELKDDLETAKASLRFDKEEIERLRAEISEQKGMIWKTQQVKKEQAARIAELEADLEQSEICIRARMDVIDQ